MAFMGRTFMAKWVGQLWKSELLFPFGRGKGGYVSLKNAGLQENTLSGYCMTTGFSPFEIPICVLLQRGQKYSPPKACFEPHSWQRRSDMVKHY